MISKSKIKLCVKHSVFKNVKLLHLGLLKLSGTFRCPTVGLVKGHHVTDGRTDCPVGSGDEDLKAVIQQVCGELIIVLSF